MDEVDLESWEIKPRSPKFESRAIARGLEMDDGAGDDNKLIVVFETGIGVEMLCVGR